MSPLETNTLRTARGESARPFTGTALDVTLRACDRNVPDPVYRLAVHDNRHVDIKKSKFESHKEHRTGDIIIKPLQTRTTPSMLPCSSTM